MRTVPLITGLCAAIVCGFAATPNRQSTQSADAVKAAPLVLEKNEGEKRMVRPWPGHPDPGEVFFLKVDPQNGGSSHLVLGTGELAPGKSIPTHRHAHADEILFVQAGTARVHVGDIVRDVHSGATVFIPANTWISADNIGNNTLTFVFIFSAPGFEDFMRATSARVGEKLVPMSPAEEDEVEKKFTHVVVYQ